MCHNPTVVPEKRYLRAVFIIVAFLTCSGPCRTDDELRVHSLPIRYGNEVVTDLRVRRDSSFQPPRIAIISTLVVENASLAVFNPFGRSNIGRSFRVVVTDSGGRVVRTLIPQTSVKRDREPGDWSVAKNGAVFGSCFWIHAESTEGNSIELPSFSAGRYAIVVLYSHRMFHAPPPTGKDALERWTHSWNDSIHDTPCCASLPVEFDVNAQGEIRWRDAHVDSFELSRVESDFRVEAGDRVVVSTRYVNPTETSLLLPGLNASSPLRGPVCLEILDQSGKLYPGPSRPALRSGSAVADFGDSVLVPRNAVVGGTHTIRIERPGRYHVKTSIDESIYTDSVFTMGKRNRSAYTIWPIALTSRPKVIDVPGDTK